MKKQQGLTLIEIMIALMLGLFIITATLAVYINTVRSSGDTIKSVRLNYDLGMTMSLMANDIRRAGYWGGAVVASNSLTNPFTTATSLTIGTNITANDCIIYTYDADSDGRVDAETTATGDTDADGKIDNEYYGFRKSSTGSIQIRSSNIPCNDTSGAWATITDESMINITDVQFSFVAMAAQAATTTAPIHGDYPALIGTSRCANFTTTATPNTNNTIDCTGITNTPTPTVAAPHSIASKQVVNIRLSGRVINDTDVQKSISGTVEIRNNRLYQITS